MRIALLVIHTNSCADALHHCHPATKLGADKEAAVAVRAQPFREPMAAQGQDYYVQVQCSRARVSFSTPDLSSGLAPAPCLTVPATVLDVSATVLESGAFHPLGIVSMFLWTVRPSKLLRAEDHLVHNRAFLGFVCT